MVDGGVKQMNVNKHSTLKKKKKKKKKQNTSHQQHAH